MLNDSLGKGSTADEVNDSDEWGDDDVVSIDDWDDDMLEGNYTNEIDEVDSYGMVDEANLENNEDVQQEAAKRQAMRDDFDRKIYAKGYLGKSDLIRPDGSVKTHTFDRDFSEIFANNAGAMLGDKNYFNDVDGNLYGLDGKPYIIKALEEQGRTAEAEEKRAEIGFYKEDFVRTKKKHGLSKREYLDSKCKEVEETASKQKEERAYLNRRSDSLDDWEADKNKEFDEREAELDEKKRLLDEEREALEEAKAEQEKEFEKRDKELRRREELCGLAENAAKRVQQADNITKPTEPQKSYAVLTHGF